MSRYVTRPSAYIEAPDVTRWRPWMEDSPLSPHIEVGGPAEVNTGLVDAAGNAIWRLPDALGFHNPKDAPNG